MCVCVRGESNVIAGNCIRDECANILELYLTIRSMEVGGCVWVYVIVSDFEREYRIV